MPPSDQKLIGLERSERLFANLEIVFKLGSNLSQQPSTLAKIKPLLSPSAFALQASLFVV